MHQIGAIERAEPLLAQTPEHCPGSAVNRKMRFSKGLDFAAWLGLEPKQLRENLVELAVSGLAFRGLRADLRLGTLSGQDQHAPQIQRR